MTLGALSQTSPRVGDHVAALDGVRGLAVLLVICSHASLTGIQMVPGIDMAGSGKVGVWLFFTLSSFLLMRQFLVLDERGSLHLAAWRSYAIRRVLRIYPLYLMFLLVCWLAPIKTYIPDMDGGDVLAHLAVVDAQWHTWSIAVELKYYVVLPLIVLAYLHVANRSLVLATLLAVCGIAVHAWLNLSYRPFALSTYITIFLTGSWVAIAHHHLRRTPMAESAVVRTLCGVASGLLFLLLLAMTPSIWGWLLDTPVAVNRWHRSFTLMALISGGFLLCTLHAPTRLQRVLGWMPFRVLGVVSFSAYLWHAIVLENLGWVPDIQQNLRAALVFVAIIAVSLVSFLLIERPFMHLGTRIARPR